MQIIIFRITIFIIILFLNSCIFDVVKGEKYAIVIGISNYNLPGSTLIYSSKDAVAIDSLFKKFGYHVILRVDQSATLSQLKMDLDSLSNVIQENDEFIFYYSGHGLDYKTTEFFGDSTLQKNEMALLLNGEFNGSYKNYIYNNKLSDRVLNDLFSKIKTTFKVSIFDACYSGKTAFNPKGSTDIDPVNFNYNESSKNFIDIAKSFVAQDNRKLENLGVVLASSGSDEISWDGFHGHSVFTYFLLQSAVGGDLNQDGEILTSEIYAYIRSGILKYWNNPIENADWNFLPHISNDAVDIVVF